MGNGNRKKGRGRMTALFWSVVRIVLGVYIGISLLMYFRQRHFVFFPSRQVQVTPAARGFDYEELFLPTADGAKICAWFVPAPDAQGTVLFCHGNAGNIGDRLGSIEMFGAMRLNVLIFDYHGYGRSTGTPSERGTYEDVQAAWEHLTKGRGLAPGTIAVFGRSLGGAVAAWLAAREPVGALVLESTFTSLPDIGAEAYPFLPIRLFLRYKYDTLARLKEVGCPVLVAHSPEDEMIGFRHGQRLFEAAPDPKRFVEMRGSHNTGAGDSGQAYRRALAAFLAEHLGK